MNISNGIQKNSNAIIISSLVIGLTIIICTLNLSSAFVKVKGLGKTISVTGAAVKPISSNYAVWEGTISTTNANLDLAYAKIREDLVKVLSFLKKKNFKLDAYDISTIQIIKNMNQQREFLDYTLVQTIIIELDDVPRLTQLAREASTLIEQGVEIKSENPKYLFTGLEELKLEMIKAATENARMRVDQLAISTNCRVGVPISANIGIFQIRPLHSTDVSNWGMNDVTSIEKEIVSTVHVDFLIED